MEQSLKEQALKEQDSKRSRSTSMSLSTDTNKGGDVLQKIMEKKKREMELKMKIIQKSSESGSEKKKATGKEEKVSHLK